MASRLRSSGLLSIGVIALMILWLGTAIGELRDSRRLISDTWEKVFTLERRRIDVLMSLVDAGRTVLPLPAHLSEQLQTIRSAAAQATTQEELVGVYTKIDSIALTVESHAERIPVRTIRDGVWQLQTLNLHIDAARNEYRRAIAQYNGHVTSVAGRVLSHILGFAPVATFPQTVAQE